MGTKTMTARQIQIARRRKVRQIETRRDQALVARDKATSDLRRCREDLKVARLG